jgi:endogenous inhibitor of DNA gyrase (YacG/DUF329 family)
MTIYKFKCANCGKHFKSNSKDFQDLCSLKCMNEVENFLRGSGVGWIMQK